MYKFNRSYFKLIYTCYRQEWTHTYKICYRRVSFPGVYSPLFHYYMCTYHVFCFINIKSGNLSCFKDQMDKIVMSLPYLFLCLTLTSLFFISLQLLLASFASNYFIMDRMKSVFSGYNKIYSVLYKGRGTKVI